MGRYVEILKGLPASGKSTYAKEKVLKSKCSVKRVNKDDLRSMLDCSVYSKGNESFVLQLRDNIILSALDLGKSVIVDDTNFHPKHEARIRELVEGFNKGKYGDGFSTKTPVQVRVKFFEVTPKEAIKRDLKRANSVGSKVIWDMYDQYLKPEAEEIKPIKQDPKLPHAIICDLDGTLAIHQDRSPFDYDRCDTDLADETIIHLLKRYKPYHILFVSGREDSCMDKTKKWLKESFNEYSIPITIDGEYNQLLMRKTGDNRKDYIVKKEIFENHIKDKYYIEFVLDDRDQVVNMWRRLGLKCFQVNFGNF